VKKDDARGLARRAPLHTAAEARAAADAVMSARVIVERCVREGVGVDDMLDALELAYDERAAELKRKATEP